MRTTLWCRNHWLEPWEKVAINSFHHQFPLEGYRRLTFMMLDRNVVAVSPSSTYRVPKAAGLLQAGIQSQRVRVTVPAAARAP